MKKLRWDISATFVSTIIVLYFVLGWTYSYNVTTPDDSESPTLGAYRIREGKLALQELLDRDLYFPLVASEVSSEYGGLHRWVTFYEPNTAPSSLPAGQGRLQTVTVGTMPELFYYDQNEQGTQITSNARLNLGDAAISNNAYIISINQAGTGTANLIKADVNNKAVLPDGALLATNAAPTVETGIAHKKYIDDSVTATSLLIFGPGVSKSKDTNYTATKSGILVVQATITWVYNTDTYVVALSDDNATPTTAVGKIGGKCTRNDSAGNILYDTTSIPIVKDKIYRVEDIGSGATIDSIVFYSTQ